MVLRRVATDTEQCKDGYTCHGVWVDDDPEVQEVGVRWYRVHVLDQPLSTYCQYEIWGYAANQAAGEQIYLVDRDAHPDLHSLHEDFWLVDDATAVRMIYDDQGRFERPELVEDARPYVAMRVIALRHAEPLNAYTARHGLGRPA